MHFPHFICIAAADPRQEQPAGATEDDSEADIPMDFDEERDFAVQGPLPNVDMEEDRDAGILTIPLKHMPS
jgi:hypothetical protein